GLCGNARHFPDAVGPGCHRGAATSALHATSVVAALWPGGRSSGGGLARGHRASSWPQRLRKRGVCGHCWYRPAAGDVDETPPNSHTPRGRRHRRSVRTAEGDRDTVEAYWTKALRQSATRPTTLFTHGRLALGHR